jgi:hypothetical protein
VLREAFVGLGALLVNSNERPPMDLDSGRLCRKPRRKSR